MNPPQKVDLTGLRCPMPIVQLNRLVKDLQVGEELIASASDPAFGHDVRAWCNKTGHELVSLMEDGAVLTATIRKQQ